MVVLIMILIFCFVLQIILSVLLYNQLTKGVCKCSRHLVEKVAIVTGANRGIGYETAKDLAERGARIILGCRNEQQGTTAKDNIIAATGNQDVHFKKLDLASFKSVREFATDVLKTEKRLDILINNAAVYGSDNVKTEDGLLLGMQTNHFGPFLLTCLLLPLLKASAPSRIINVTSLAYIGAGIDFDNLDMESGNLQRFPGILQHKVYFVSKLCNVLTTVELARRLQGTRVTANSVHPGIVITSIWRDMPVIKYFKILIKPFMKTSWEGAQTLIYLAVSPDVEVVSGRYYADCRQATTYRSANDQEVARKLWEYSESYSNFVCCQSITCHKLV